jgi:hypothetical protein
MYTNSLIKVFSKPLFDSIFPFFKNSKLHFTFCQMIKKTLTPSKFSMEEHFSTLKNHNYKHCHTIM